MAEKILDLIWLANFKDGSELCQYEKDETENNFKRVLDKQDDLKYFVLIHKNTGVSYIVDLERGCISCGLLSEPIFEPRVDMLRKHSYHYRLIYFREVERSFNSTLQEVEEPKITYFIGFQYTDENNTNQKRIIKINNKGNWIVN